MELKYNIKGLPSLEAKVQKLSAIRWEAVANKSLDDIFIRAGRKQFSTGTAGTPIRMGELVKSRRKIPVSKRGSGWKGSMAYIKSYALPVELGHRVVLGGVQYGYVPARLYLKANVDQQKKIYKKDLLEALDRA